MTSRVGIGELVLAMLREEWRLHSSLFGGARFAGFPVFLFSLVTLAGATLALVEVDPGLVVAGAVGLAGLFGLQTGSIGFTGRDELEDLLGGGTVLLYTARTLPISRQRAVTAFLIKDALYYVLLFVVSMAIGAIVGPLAVGVLAPDVGTGLDPGALETWLLLGHAILACTLAFCLGLSVTLVGTDLFSRGARRATTAVLLLALLAVLAWILDLVPAADTLGAALVPPYHPGAYLLGALVVATLSAVGIWRFSYPTGGGVRRRTDAYERLRGWVGPFASRPFGSPRATSGTAAGHPDAVDRAAASGRDGQRAAVLVKTVLDVHRSSGGTWKLFVSSAILVLAAAAVLEAVQQWVLLEVSHAIVFGALLSATTFPTYNWVMRADDPSEYHHLPIPAGTLLSGKVTAVVLLEVPVAVLYYLLVIALFAPTIAELVLGGLLLAGLAAYLIGVTAAITGFRPDEFLFDTPSFVAYAAAGTIALVPGIVLGLAGSMTLFDTLGLVIVGYSLLATALGLVSYWWARRRWRHECELAP